MTLSLNSIDAVFLKMDEDPLMDDVPYHIREAIALYIVHGYSPGSTTAALLANDFARFVQCCDAEYEKNAVNVMRWLQRNAPADACGTRSKVLNWRGTKPEVM
jgi:hypothetical protein